MLEQFTVDIINWITALPAFSVYAILFAIAYGENIIPPIPGDVIVAFGGYLAAQNTLSFTLVYLGTTIASVFGFMSLFTVGWYFGGQIMEHPHRIRVFKFIKFKDFEKAQNWMNNYGQWAVVTNRFLPGMRSLISIVAGISHTPPVLTMSSSALSSAMWNFILIGGGWLLHENWKTIGYYLNVYSRIILAIVGLVLLFVLIKHLVKRKKKPFKKLESKD